MIVPANNSYGPRFRDLSESRQRFVRALQALDFGCIENLVIRRGYAVSDPRTKTLKTLKLKNEGDTRAEAALADFDLKREVVAFLKELDLIQDGIIPLIEVRNGLPEVMQIHTTLVL